MINDIYIKIFGIIVTAFVSNLSNAQEFEQKFQFVLDSTYQMNKDAIGIMIHVESPNNNVSWTSAVGYSNKKRKEKINKDQPLLIASNTKTYISATILKLVENGHIKLDQPIKRLLHKKTKKLLNKEGYNLNKITIKHLLSHTSGITDYVNNDYFKFVDENPNYKWTRDEQIGLAMQIANPTQAGKAFAYGDINYLLLSEIIESTTGKLFYISIREFLDFKAHYLNTTWFIDLEDKPLHSLPLAHQYDDIYNWDSYDLNPSWDLYGGGGLASTTKDLALFFQLLFEGKIIKDVKILSQIYSYVIPKEESKNYCLGLYNFPSCFGNKAYYHGGWWGTDVIYLPELNTTISAFTLLKEKRGLNAEISHKIIKILTK